MVRIAAALDATTVPLWTHRLLSAIAGDGDLELVAMVLDAPTRPSPPPGPLAWRAYVRVDAALAPMADDALASTDASALVRGLPAGGEPVDVVLDLTATGLVAAPGAAHGTWRVELAGVPGEVVTEAAIRCRDAGTGPGRIVHTWRASTDPGSLRRGRSAGAFLAGDVLLRRLRRLARQGAVPDDELGGPPRDQRPLRGGEALRFATRTLGSVAARRARRPFVRDVWAVAARERRPATGPVPDLSDGWRLLRPPAGRFYADPFCVETAEGAWLFFEEWRDDRARAHISCVPLPLEPGPVEPLPVLERDHHLSYPFVLEHGGEHFLIPESADARSVQLWRAEALPDRWVLDTVLLEGTRMFDATVLHRDGRWWMWVTIAADGGPVSVDCSLFAADDLRGPWTEHPASPIAADVRGARPAGGLFEHDGRLLRPAQDSTGWYGRALVLHEVVTLTPDAYEERTLGTVEAQAVVDGARATHTYAHSAGFEAIDVQLPVRRGRAPASPVVE